MSEEFIKSQLWQNPQDSSEKYSKGIYTHSFTYNLYRDIINAELVYSMRLVCSPFACTKMHRCSVGDISFSDEQQILTKLYIKCVKELIQKIVKSKYLSLYGNSGVSAFVGNYDAKIKFLGVNPYNQVQIQGFGGDDIFKRQYKEHIIIPKKFYDCLDNFTPEFIATHYELLNDDIWDFIDFDYIKQQYPEEFL